MTEIIASFFALLAFFLGGSSDTNQKQSPSPQQQKTQQALVAKAPPGKANVSVEQPLTSIPTPALLPGIIGLGAAALRKRKTALVKHED